LILLFNNIKWLKQDVERLKSESSYQLELISTFQQMNPNSLSESEDSQEEPSSIPNEDNTCFVVQSSSEANYNDYDGMPISEEEKESTDITSKNVRFKQTNQRELPIFETLTKETMKPESTFPNYDLDLLN